MQTKCQCSEDQKNNKRNLEDGGETESNAKQTKTDGPPTTSNDEKSVTEKIRQIRR